MLSFFINCYRLAKIIFTGLKDDKEFRFLFIFILLLLIGANVFYTQVENWSIIDSLYFAVMTMATIGYGDLIPTSDLSKLFTIVYSFLAIGTFVSFTAKCVQMMFENHQKNKAKMQLQHKKDKGS